jgi:hypothetical protein
VRQPETRDSCFIRGEVKATVLLRGTASRTKRATSSYSDLTGRTVDNERNSKYSQVQANPDRAADITDTNSTH